MVGGMCLNLEFFVRFCVWFVLYLEEFCFLSSFFFFFMLSLVILGCVAGCLGMFRTWNCF